MIGPVVTRGLTFAIKYIVTAGFLSGGEPAPPASAHNLYRDPGAIGASDVFRGSAGDGSSLYRPGTSRGGNLYR